MRSLGGYSCSSRLCGPEGGGAFSLAGVGHAEAFQPDQSAWHADPEVPDGAACRERGAGRQHRCQTPGGGVVAAGVGATPGHGMVEWATVRPGLSPSSRSSIGHWSAPNLRD